MFIPFLICFTHIQKKNLRFSLNSCLLTRLSTKLFHMMVGDRDNNPVGRGSGEGRGEAPAADRGADTRVQGLGIFLSSLGGHQVSLSH